MTCELRTSVEPPELPPGLRLSVVPWESTFTRPGAAQAYGIPESIRQADQIEAVGGAEVARQFVWREARCGVHQVPAVLALRKTAECVLAERRI